MNRFYVVSYALLFLLPGLVCSRAPDFSIRRIPSSRSPNFIHRGGSLIATLRPRALLSSRSRLSCDARVPRSFSIGMIPDFISDVGMRQIWVWAT